jgi:predicted alpha/beta hydrolase family esterase
MSSATRNGFGRQQEVLDSLGSAVDEAFLTLPRLLRALRPARSVEREAYERELNFYIDGGYVAKPETFFTLPAETPRYSIIERRAYQKGKYELISYASEYVPRNHLVRPRYESFAANRTGYLVRWTHGLAGRKTILCHHGFMLGEPQQARRMFRVDRLFAAGLDVALYVAPFHWRRGSASLSQRGIYLQNDDVALTCECVGQTVYDMYGAFLILKALEAAEVGLIGASLGGHNVALFVALSDVASFGALVVPAITFEGPVHPDRARLAFDVDEPFRQKMRSVWDLHSPLRLAPRIPPERMLVVAARGDRLCPFAQTEMLCEKWGIAHRSFLTGGHWLAFDRGKRGRAWYGFLEEMGFLASRPRS